MGAGHLKLVAVIANHSEKVSSYQSTLRSKDRFWHINVSLISGICFCILAQILNMRGVRAKMPTIIVRPRGPTPPTLVCKEVATHALRRGKVRLTIKTTHCRLAIVHPFHMRLMNLSQTNSSPSPLPVSNSKRRAWLLMAGKVLD